MSNKIRIKVGIVEVEYEGTEEFIKNDLLDLVTSVAEFHKAQPIDDQVNSNDNNSTNSRADISGTTGSFAAKLSCQSGTDLILAAVANLKIVQGKASSHRKEILSEMKTASAYYKKTYSNNLSKYLNNLVKDGKLLETAKDVYALEASTLKSMEGKVA